MASPDGPRDRATDPGRQLRLATERMYAAFESVPFDPAMPRNPGSVSAADVEALAAPVADLPPAVIARFLMKAGTTWGTPDDLRRVAPRALELAADQKLPIDRGLLWAKLRWADWSSWPTYQAATVREFLRREWARLVRTAPRPAHVGHRWLRWAANGAVDLDPYLAEWHEALDPDEPAPYHRAATGHLVLLLVNSPLRPDLPETMQQVLPERPAAASQLTDWLGRPETVDRLTSARDRLSDTTDARRVGVAVERLVRFNAAVSRRSTTSRATV